MTFGPTRFIDHRGCRLAYRVTGDGPTVLMVQGVGTVGDAWRPQVEALSGRYRCVTLDNRGVGQNQPGDEAMTVELMAEDAAAVLDAVGGPAHLVGHSLGGPVVIQLAADRPDRVRSLSLLCTFARGKSVGPLSWRMVWAGARVALGPRRTRRRAFLELLVPPSALRGVDRDALAASLAAVFGRDLADQPPAVPAQMRAMRRYDATPRLAALAGLPVLVVSADRDPIAPPRLGRELAAGIPRSRFVVLGEASHGVTVYQPDRVNGLLLDHLAAAEGR